MNLGDLYRELERHDWFFEMSDDHGVWSAGHEDKRRLIREAMKIEGGQKLMADFSKHHFSGEAFGTPKEPKPERPADREKGIYADLWICTQANPYDEQKAKASGFKRVLHPESKDGQCLVCRTQMNSEMV